MQTPTRVRIHYTNGDDPTETIFDGAEVRLWIVQGLCAVPEVDYIEILGVGPDA